MRKDIITLTNEMKFGKSEEAKIEATNALFMECINYVHSVVRQYFMSFKEEYEDLVHEGFLAVAECIPSYDYNKGTLTTYVKPFVFGRICKYIQKNITHTTDHYQQLHKKIKKAILELENQDEEVTDHAISQRAGISIKSIQKAKESIVHFEPMTKLDSLQKFAQTYSPEEAVLKREQTDLLNLALSKLSEMERNVFVTHTMAAGWNKFQETAKVFSLTTKDTRAIYCRAVRKLKKDRDLLTLMFL